MTREEVLARLREMRRYGWLTQAEADALDAAIRLLSEPREPDGYVVDAGEEWKPTLYESWDEVRGTWGYALDHPDDPSYKHPRIRAFRYIGAPPQPAPSEEVA